MITNPFNYGKPVVSDRFIGRRREIEQIQSRLLNTEFESSSIVGERRIGKTSLLKYLSHSNVRQNAEFPLDSYIFIYLDLQMIDASITPTLFWQHILQNIKTHINNEALQASIDDVCREQSIYTFLLDSLFRLVDDINLHIVLLLDEFETVCQNKNFDVDFFSGLRAMAIHHNLALITSSRHELVDLTHSKEIKASPFFNIFSTINLRPFSEEEAETLIETYLARNEISFGRREIDYILKIAGLHPHFLQMACFFLYEAHLHTDDAQLRRGFLNAEFRKESASWFSDYWHHSLADQRVLLTVMSLRHLDRDGTGSDTLEQLKRYYSGAERTLMALEKRGLVLAEANETKRYRPFSLVFCDWVIDELRSGIGDDSVWIKWQTKQAGRLNKLPAELRQGVLDLLPDLNSKYADSIGDWLLSSSTVNLALSLLENFLGNYQEILSRRPSPPVAESSLTSNIIPKTSANRDRIQSLNRQIRKKTQNLYKLEEQAAEHGAFIDVPLTLLNQIEAIKGEIEQLESELEELDGEGQNY